MICFTISCLRYLYDGEAGQFLNNWAINVMKTSFIPSKIFGPSPRLGLGKLLDNLPVVLDFNSHYPLLLAMLMGTSYTSGLIHLYGEQVICSLRGSYKRFNPPNQPESSHQNNTGAPLTSKRNSRNQGWGREEEPQIVRRRN